MNIFFTSDMHFGHFNIIEFCDRPFESVAEMDSTLISNWNSVVGPNDLVYHLGDFVFKGKNSVNYIESQLNGKLIHIRGNHDRKSWCKLYPTSATLIYRGIKIYLTHQPAEKKGVPASTHVVFCGHVHQRWVWEPIEGLNIKNINVGTDVWGFKPVGIDKLLKLI